MVNVPNVYQTIQDKVLTFTFTDVVTGTGYITFHAVDLDGDIYRLIPFQIPSNDYYTTATVNSPTISKKIDLTFDSDTFNKTIKAKGRMYVEAVYSGWPTGANNITVYTKITVSHIDAASSATVIGAQTQTETLTLDGSSSDGTNERGIITVVPWDIDQLFKIGEKVRLGVELWASATSGTHSVRLYHSGDNTGTGPTERATLSDPARVLTTELKLNLPVLSNI